MEIKIDRQDDIMVLSLSGRMDAVSSPAFDKELERLISESNKRFILDLSALDYISSAGLRSILLVSKRLKQEGGALLLSCLKDMVKEVFDISGFSSIIPIYDTVESAKSNIG